ncbi:MAG: hypothetical protein K2L22_05360 [Muribaculaceae bacterium]|nr:hypothetical protein [Muribaculaceae bacterium]
MKSRAKFFLTMTASALTLFASQAISAAAATAPAHAPAASDPEKADTLVYSATKSLIESFGELSKTASKLSETALKLLEAQESIDEKKSGTPQQKRTPKTERKQEPVIEQTNNVYISDSQEEIPVAQEMPIIQQAPVVVSDTVYVTVTDTIRNSVWYLPEENREGGKYLWIPDANLSNVEAILSGEAPASIKGAVNLNEMTYWRGDSIPMALPTKRLGRFDRKLYNWLIYPKGVWHISLTANYGELSTDDSEFLSLIQDVDLKGKIYSVKPSVSYFLRNNLCVGLRLAFTKGEMGINSFKVDIDEDMSFDLHDIKYNSDSYAAAVFIQQYFGLSRRGRFAVFNEAEVSVGTGSSHFIRPFDGVIRDTRTKTQSFNINYSPGVSIMMMKNAAFNLSFGIFGFHLKDEKQWENGEEAGSRFTSGINFRFNLFNINFGVSIII